MTTCYYFKLVHNGEVRYMEDEPIGWDSIPIVLKRDPQWHGVNYEFTKDNTTLDFDCEALGDWIDSIYAAEGLDALIEFHYGMVRNTVERAIYSGKLNLITFKRSKNRVQCGLERSSLQETIRSRFDSKLNLFDNKTLDAAVITEAFVPSSLQLHSKALKKSFKTDPTKGVQEYDAEFLGEGGQTYQNFLYYSTTNPLENTISQVNSYPLQVQTTRNLTFIEIKQDPGNYTLEIKTHIIFNLFLNYAGSPWDGDRRGFAHIVTASYLVINGKSETISHEGVRLRDYNRAGSPNFSINIDFKKEYTFKQGDKIELCSEISFKGKDFKGYKIWVKCNQCDINIVGITQTDPTKCNGLMVHNAIDRALLMTTGKSVLYSKYFGKTADGYETDGCGALNFITNGFQIRGFGEDKPIQITLKELLNSLQAIFALGLGYEYKNGEEKMVIEPLDYFYAGKEILFIPDCADYEEESADDLVYNIIDIGYKNYPDEGAQLLDEFNTQHQYLTPIKRHDNKLELISELIASGYAIEFSRRDRYDPSNESKSSTKYDDHNFIISCVLGPIISTGVIFNQTFNQIVLNDSFAVRSIFKGAVILITEAGENEGELFTVTNIVLNFSSRKMILQVNEPMKSWSGEARFRILNGSYKTETTDYFSVVKGTLLAPQTSCNLSHSPKRMLLRWAKWINGGLVHKKDSEVIKNTFAKQNGDLTTMAFSRCANRVWEQSKEKDDVFLADFAERERIFLPEWVRFTARLHREQVEHIKMCMMGATSTDQDYGYISVLNPKGDRVGGYIYDMEYNPNTEKVSFTLLKKIVLLHNSQDTDQVNCQDYADWTFQDFEASNIGKEIEDCRFINFN